MQPLACCPYAGHQGFGILRIEDEALDGAAFLDLQGYSRGTRGCLEPPLAVWPAADLDLAELNGLESGMLPRLGDELFGQADGRGMGSSALIALESFHIDSIYHDPVRRAMNRPLAGTSVAFVGISDIVSGLIFTKTYGPRTTTIQVQRVQERELLLFEEQEDRREEARSQEILLKVQEDDEAQGVEDHRIVRSGHA